MAIALAVAGLAVAPHTAAAGVVGSSDGELTFGDDERRRNELTIALSGAEFVLTERGADSSARSPAPAAACRCRARSLAARRAGSRSSASGSTTVDDRLTVTAPVPAEITAGDGDDVVIGGPAADLIFGELGDDSVAAAAATTR